MYKLLKVPANASYGLHQFAMISIRVKCDTIETFHNANTLVRACNMNGIIKLPSRLPLDKEIYR